MQTHRNIVPAGIRGLAELVRRATPGDRSILMASLETQDCQVATVRGSSNAVLWGRLVELGWAREMPLDIELPAGLAHVQPQAFALTEAGRDQLPDLLAAAT